MIVKSIVMLVLTAGAYIYPALQEKMANASPEAYIEAVVHLKEKADFEGKKNLSPKDYVDYLKSFSRESQSNILEFLQENFSDQIVALQPYWIFNGFFVRAKPEVLNAIAERNDVEYLVDNYEIKLFPTAVSKNDLEDAKTPEWNVSIVSAPQCWNDGYDGTGQVVGHLDTGVESTHPALANKWVGSPYWHDAVNSQPNPYDDNGHGTHTMGTILGGDGPGSFTNDVGVAPGATYVSCKVFDSYGSSSVNWIHIGFQKIAEWKADGINIVASSNSWGSTDVTNLEYWEDVLNWRNLDIVPVFAAGNNGPSAGTINTPGSFPTVIGVGATNSSDNMYSGSCRGPAPNQNPWNDTLYWPRSDWNLIKPDISAPGYNVRSSYPGNSYTTLTGTSMATPHVAGAIAILKQKNPTLDFYDIYSLLVDHADHPSQGEPYPNNNYAWGRLNIYNALINTPDPTAPNIVLSNYTWSDEDSNNIWDPGENIQVVITLRNSGIEATNVNATLRTTSSYATISDSTSSFGTMTTNQSSSNIGDPFLVQSDPSTPTGTVIPFSLYINSDGGYEWNYNLSITVGVPGLDYNDHSPGNIVLTVTRYGALGYMSSDGTQGSGCKYPSSSNSHLFYGSFAVGTVMPYVIDRYYESASGDDDDWVTLTDPNGMVYLYIPYPPYHEYSQAIYSDAGGEEVKGLRVYQRGYTFNDGYGPNYVILEYTLYNTTPTTIEDLYAGLFTDWDIGDASYNTGGTDNTRNMAYVYYSSTFMGTAILNPSRIETNKIANRSLIDHDTYVYPYNGLPDNVEIGFLNGTYSIATSNRNYDWSSVVSAGPLDVPPYDSVKVAFTVAGSSTLANLRTNIDDAYSRYWSVIVGLPEGASSAELHIPTILKSGELTMKIGNTCKEVKITVFDVKGSRVGDFDMTNPKGEVSINLGDLPGGVYFIRVQGDGLNKTEKVILLK
ncbi:MAG: S8 family serine peptidase [Candidatus Hydrothermia bacterium]